MSTVLEAPAPAAPTERKIPNYRQQIRKALPPEIFKPDFSALWHIPLHLAVIGGCWYLLANYFSFWLAPLLSIVIGHSMACMGFVAHDTLHGGTIKNLVLRDLIGGFAFSPLWISPRLWRRWHNTDHHGHTQIEGVDPDHLFTLESCKDNPILKMLYKLSPLARNIVIFGSFCFRMTQQTLRMYFIYLFGKKVGAWEKLVMTSQIVGALVGWSLLAYFAAGNAGLIWGYLVPLLVANTVVILYIATNHFLNPLADENDVLATSLTVTMPRGFGWVDTLHQNFGAHVAHHLFPQVSAKHARLIETKAAELFPNHYHAMPFGRALKLLWQTPWVYDDKTSLIDPQLDKRYPTLGHGLK